VALGLANLVFSLPRAVEHVELFCCGPPSPSSHLTGFSILGLAFYTLSLSLCFSDPQRSIHREQPQRHNSECQNNGLNKKLDWVRSSWS